VLFRPHFPISNRPPKGPLKSFSALDIKLCFSRKQHTPHRCGPIFRGLSPFNSAPSDSTQLPQTAQSCHNDGTSAFRRVSTDPLLLTHLSPFCDFPKPNPLLLPGKRNLRGLNSLPELRPGSHDKQLPQPPPHQLSPHRDPAQCFYCPQSLPTPPLCSLTEKTHVASLIRIEHGFPPLWPQCFRWKISRILLQQPKLPPQEGLEYRSPRPTRVELSESLPLTLFPLESPPSILKVVWPGPSCSTP